MTNEIIIKEAEEYISNNLNMTDTAKKLGISKRTLQLHFKKLEDIDKKLYIKVLEKQKLNIIAGRSKGGELGKRGKTYNSEEAFRVAKIIIDKQLTYRDAEELLGIPSSTIFEMLHSEYIDEKTRMQLELVAEANTKDKSVSALIESRK